MEKIVPPIPIIPLGARCIVTGTYTLDATIASRTLGAEDGTTQVILDFNEVPFTCASDSYMQSVDPVTVRLLARVYEGKVDSPQSKLLFSLSQLQRLQRRSNHIYDDDEPIVDLSATPIVAVELEGAIPQRDFITGQKYTPFVIRVKRSSVSLCED